MSNIHLKFQILKNIGFMSIIKYSSKIAMIITGIILARLLNPSDFGIYGLALSVVAVVLIFNEMGLRSAVIQKKTEHEEVLFYTGFFIKSALSIFLFMVILLFIAPWSAQIYENPDVKNVIIFLALIMLIDNFKFIPETRIIKSNNFKKLMVPLIIENISYSVSVIILALLGFKYWSFVYAKLFSFILGTTMFIFVMPWKLHIIFNKRIGKELLNFGKFLLLGGFLSMVIKQMDNLIVGKMLGMTALGYYTIAYRWGSMFSLDIGKIVNRVLFPINVKYQNDLPMLQKIQVQSIKYVSLITFPISFGVIAICPEFVRGVLGEKWAPAIIPLQIFSIHGLFSALMKRGEIFVALGKPFQSIFFALIFIPILLSLIFPFTYIMGIKGTALAVLITFIFVNFFLQWIFLKRYFQFDIYSILSKFTIPLVSSLIMFVFIYILKTYLYSFKYEQVSILIISVFAGIVIYMICLLLFIKDEVKTIIKILIRQDITINEKILKLISAL